MIGYILWTLFFMLIWTGVVGGIMLFIMGGTRP